MDILSIKDFLISKFKDYDFIIDFAKDCKAFSVKNRYESTFEFLSSGTQKSFYVIIVSFKYDNCDYSLKYFADSKELLGFSLFYDSTV